MVLVDEAHAMGFYGPNGRGVYEEQGVADQVDFVVGTFSKSVGTVGGFCVSDHPKLDVLRLVSRPYVFTASLPPAVVAMAECSIRKLMHGHNKRAHLWENTRALHGGLRALGFDIATATPESAIIAVLMPDQVTTARMWATLLEMGVYVNMASPPRDPGRHVPAALLAVRRSTRPIRSAACWTRSKPPRRASACRWPRAYATPSPTPPDDRYVRRPWRPVAQSVERWTYTTSMTRGPGDDAGSTPARRTSLQRTSSADRAGTRARNGAGSPPPPVQLARTAARADQRGVRSRRRRGSRAPSRAPAPRTRRQPLCEAASASVRPRSVRSDARCKKGRPPA